MADTEEWRAQETAKRCGVPQAYGDWGRAEVEHVLRVLRGREDMIVKREEVPNVMRILDGLYKSAEVGREVVLED